MSGPFNPAPRVQVLPIDARHACYVVDDALRAPEQLVRFAAQHRGRFRMAPHNAFPGLELRMPEAFDAQLDHFFRVHIRSRLGARRTVRMYSRLSMVTLPPNALSPPQWICHRDRLQQVQQQLAAACVLYLFEDPALGGTSFFRPRLSPEETALMVHESGALPPAAFAGKYGVRPGYFTESNACFEKVLTVPPRWNRLIFYDGDLFHSGDIAHPERLSDDPHRGRLTLNGFFVCTRALA